MAEYGLYLLLLNSSRPHLLPYRLFSAFSVSRLLSVGFLLIGQWFLASPLMHALQLALPYKSFGQYSAFELFYCS